MDKSIVMIGGFEDKGLDEAQDVMVSYKVFKSVVRAGSKLIPLASVDAMRTCPLQL